ncbi:MAG: hypothetical protein ACRDGQ_06725 [Candidatus Limnocylindrales bacterium]
MIETERYGRPHFLCPSCPYGSFDRAYTEAHLREHEPRQSLDDLIAAASVPAPEVSPAKPRTKKEP